MAKYVKQVRYYGDGSNKNTPSSNKSGGYLQRSELSRGTAFRYDSSLGAGIVQLGVQTLPGVQFVINTAPTPVTVGSTGIYELNVDGLTTIDSLSFTKQSLDLIDQNESAYIIVDFIYEKE